ncbi:DUF3078 domain-containing protein [Mangrovimonas sp. DI 80]|uniref:DUF3078 domain-containing protein n=1 Tax=Mangrovimonas sp. DI 80 TaxID=1779330 RepID=UPI000978869F|nr:DUF3078 domain-containing protein [Mangrovimonas sp. DI 80]OMP30349.1 hypothetical protein BKM32_13285 [Mangrovimonas sp. DI 80]
MKNVFVLLFVLSVQCVLAQPDSLFVKKPIKHDIKPKWTQSNKLGFDLSEVAFVNWNSGGSNSISALLGLTSNLGYKYKNFSWQSVGTLRYGINKQQGQEVRKTDDVIELVSNMGYRRDTLTNWFYSARFNFKTQLTNGYKYPETSKPISQFMAPGYLFLGGGVEYGKNIEKLSFYFSPMTFKSTFVLDEALSNAGSFGVTPAVFDADGNVIVQGQRIRTEMGILFTNSFETPVYENINLINRLSLYTDYINSFGNIDIDWEVLFNFKVNKYVKTSFGSHLIYDNDVKNLEATEVEGEYEKNGARIQWKQLLGVGVVVGF